MSDRLWETRDQKTFPFLLKIQVDMVSRFISKVYIICIVIWCSMVVQKVSCNPKPDAGVSPWRDRERYFQLLGLQPGIYEKVQIEKAFRMKSLYNHPDKVQSEKEKEERTKNFYDLQDARDALIADIEKGIRYEAKSMTNQDSSASGVHKSATLGLVVLFTNLFVFMIN